MADTEEGRTVAVTSKGQATIPKAFREKLRIETPGRVRFVENDDGEVVVRPVDRPEDLRGSLSADDAEPAESATEYLRRERADDRRALDDAAE
ncbi:MAG: AbrB/MazE/SpoVT family DNA-binding domain-containing protein [Halobacteriaceae archaeon]